MADLDSAFREYYPPSREQRQAAMTEGMVCLDTNVLLDAYRFNPRVRDELLVVLEKLSNRLWVPHQVAFEFHKNRINVISDQAKSYTDALKSLEEFRGHFAENIISKIGHLGRTVALTKAEGEDIVRPILAGINSTIQEIGALQQRHGVHLDMITNDNVLARLESLLKGKVGDPYTAEDEEKERQEAQRRIDNKLPPGYADASKSDPHGDYLLWSQILREAKIRNAPILFVTRDGKSDWFRREKGQTISARVELIREARETAGCELIAMSTQTFLLHAREYLDAQVSDELLREVEKFPEPEDDLQPNSSARQSGDEVTFMTRVALHYLLKEIESERSRLRSLTSQAQRQMDHYSHLLEESDSPLERSVIEDQRGDSEDRLTALRRRIRQLSQTKNFLRSPVVINEGNSVGYPREHLERVLSIIGSQIIMRGLAARESEIAVTEDESDPRLPGTWI
ncbi:PIN-like domain-containing protein [Microbispora bryophytorum]|uniref:PIN-like domain-containing protein n=1 Tax=Microbispora bryophytorum TaxID=1460882 RepID=UPI0033FBB319